MAGMASARDEHQPLDFSSLAASPSTLYIPRISGRAAIPPLNEPTTMPDAPPIHRGAALTPLAGERVVDLSAYWHAEVNEARRVSVARPEVVAKVQAAARRLPAGFGLAVFDAWRPLAVQQALFDAAYADTTLSPGFVTPPSSDPRTPPPHLTGGTVDVTLTWKGITLALGTAFDDFTARAHARALEGTLDPSRDLRRVLYWTMRSVGFVVIDCEWWHFEYGTRRWAAITDRDPIYGAVTPRH